MAQSPAPILTRTSRASSPQRRPISPNRAPIHSQNPMINLQTLRKHTQEFLRDLRQNNQRLSKKMSHRLPSLEHLDTGRRDRLEQQRRQDQTEIETYRQSLEETQLEPQLNEQDADQTSQPQSPVPIPPTTFSLQFDRSRPRISTLYEARRETQRSLSPRRLYFEGEYHGPNYREPSPEETIHVPQKQKSKREGYQIGPFGLHSSEIPSMVPDFQGVPTSILTKDESYFDELETFRRQHPNLFYERAQPMGSPDFFNEDQQPVERTEEIMWELDRLPGPITQDMTEEAIRRGQHVYKTGVHTGGYFRVNERYYPTKERNPFLERAAEEHVLDEDDLDEEQHPPVKVSIPKNMIQVGPRQYKPHTRANYDPGNSISLAAHLHQGYIPFMRRKKTVFRLFKPEMSNF